MQNASMSPKSTLAGAKPSTNRGSLTGPGPSRPSASQLPQSRPRRGHRERSPPTEFNVTRPAGYHNASYQPISPVFMFSRSLAL